MVTGQTSFNADRSAAAEAKIAAAVEKINDTTAKMRALSERFQAAAGSDQKNGNLKAQSQSEQQNKQRKGDSTVQAAEKDQQTAAEARGTYLADDGDNAASINSTNLGDSAP
jgi:hypothetical protein